MKASKILRIAVATVFAGGSAISFAALTSAGAQMASELPVGGILVTSSAAGELNASSNTTTFAPSAGQSLQVSVTLDNGAKFSASPTLQCQVLGVAATAGTAVGTLNLGGAGSNQAIFTMGQVEVSAVASGGSVSACTARIPSVTVTGAHVTNNASITYQYGTLASSVESGPIITWKKGISASVSSLGQSPVALVTGGFLNVSGGVSGSPSLVLSAGVVTYTQNNSGSSTATDASFRISAGDAMSTASITVGGAPLGAARTTAGVWITVAANECTGARIASATGGLASVTFSGLTSAQVSAGVNVCVLFNGTTAVPEGPITATIVATPLTGYTTDTSVSSNTLVTVTRNGSSTRALNIPAANNSDLAFIRVTNTSPIAGKLYGTLYGQDGVVLGTANTILADAAAFAQNVTLAFDVPTLKTALGITSDWTGRAQLVLTAETTSLRAQNLIRVSNGTLVNVGGDTSSNNN